MGCTMWWRFYPPSAFSQRFFHSASAHLVISGPPLGALCHDCRLAACVLLLPYSPVSGSALFLRPRRHHVPLPLPFPVAFLGLSGAAVAHRLGAAFAAATHQLPARC
jgi:hypothetical protein